MITLCFSPEQRWPSGLWFAVDLRTGVELAPCFEKQETCEEIGRRCLFADYMTNIPVVPYSDSYPRDPGRVMHPAKVRDGTWRFGMDPRTVKNLNFK